MEEKRLGDFTRYFASQLRLRQGVLDCHDESDGEKKPDCGLKKELLIMKHEETSPFLAHNIAKASIPIIPERVKAPQQDLGSPATQFNEIVHKELALTGKEADIPKPLSNLEHKELASMKQEIVALSEMVQSLNEKERDLAVQLLECKTLRDAEVGEKQKENEEKLSIMLEIVELKCSVRALQEKERDLEKQMVEYNNLIDVQTCSPNLETKEIGMEEEINELRKVVKSMQEREQNLEKQMMEYSTSKGQADVAKELENLQKMHAIEAQLYTVKIESLQKDNKRLEDKVSNYSRVLVDLESARARIKVLKRKLRFNTQRAKEKMATLYQRIAALHQRERANQMRIQDANWNFDRIKDLEDEIADLRRETSRLMQENSDLMMKLESTPVLGDANFEFPKENGEMNEESHIKEDNESIKDIDHEQALSTQCTDIEYTFSENDASSLDINPKLSSSSRSSLREVMNETSTPMTVTKSDNKPKFMGRLKRLVSRKDKGKNKIPLPEQVSKGHKNSQSVAQIVNSSMQNKVASEPYDTISSSTTTANQSRGKTIEGMEEADLAQCRRSRSDLSSSYGYKRFNSGSSSQTPESGYGTPEMQDLGKPTKALKSSSRKAPLMLSPYQFC